MSDIFDQPQRPRRERQRKSHTGRNVILVFLGIFLVAALVAGGYLFNLAQTFNNSTQKLETAFPEESLRPSKEPEDQTPGPEAMNILLMGADAGGSTPAELVEGNAPGSRTDTLMLMHIPADRENVYVMSILRDTWTDIPGYGTHKINAAMAFGGIPLTVQTVEGLFDERIDHVAVIDFEGFKSLTNALGGVTVDVPYTFTSSGSMGETFTAGPTTLDGESALKFVRERKAFADGDYQRAANQQIFVKSILSKFLTAETLTNPVRINEVVTEFSPYLAVDNEFDAGTVASLGLSLRGVRTNDVEMFTLPTLGTGTSADGQSIVLKDEAAIADISEALDNGTVGQYLTQNGLG